MKTLKLLILPLIFLSCATLFKGSKDTVNFSSDPNGAKVVVFGIDHSNLLQRGPGHFSQARRGFRPTCFSTRESPAELGQLGILGISFPGTLRTVSAVL